MFASGGKLRLWVMERDALAGLVRANEPAPWPMKDPQRGVLVLEPNEAEGDASVRPSGLEMAALLEAVKLGIRQAAASENVLIDYAELARRLKLGIRATKDLVNRGRITPALRYGNVARFHWPSVLHELQRHPGR
jgi:hypothetical protein